MVATPYFCLNWTGSAWLTQSLPWHLCQSVRCEYHFYTNTYYEQPTFVLSNTIAQPSPSMYQRCIAVLLPNQNVMEISSARHSFVPMPPMSSVSFGMHFYLYMWEVGSIIRRCQRDERFSATVIGGHDHLSTLGGKRLRSEDDSSSQRDLVLQTYLFRSPMA